MKTQQELVAEFKQALDNCKPAIRSLISSSTSEQPIEDLRNILRTEISKISQACLVEAILEFLIKELDTMAKEVTVQMLKTMMNKLAESDKDHQCTCPMCSQQQPARN